MKDEFAAGCGHINGFRQRDKIDASLFEEVEGLDEDFERTPQAVERASDHSTPRPPKGQELLQPASASKFEPVMTSLKYFSQPASFSASLWSTSFCSCLETRTEPIFMALENLCCLCHLLMKVRGF